MYNDVDVPELKRMADLAEAQPEELFCMKSYVKETDCGTAGCLLGTWSMHSHGDRFRIFEGEFGGSTFSFNGVRPLYFDELHAASMRFGVPWSICEFLFQAHCTIESELDGRCCLAAVDLTQAEAIARLRKYIAHVEDQRRKWANHEWLMQRPKAERRKVLLSPRSALAGAI